MIKTPADLKDYFAALATALGCSFEFGNSERIIQRQLSQLTYPLLWLEHPEVRLLRDGGLKREFQCAFLFLSNADVDDFAGQHTRLDEMFALTEQALQMLQASSTDEFPAPFDFDMEQAQSQYKGKWSADDDWGWRTEFRLIGAACETADCCDGDSITLPATPGNLIEAPSGTVSIGANRLVYAIVILPADADYSFRVGTTPGGNEIVDDEPVSAGAAWTSNAQHFFQSAGSLYFSVTTDVTVIVYSR